MKEKLRVKATSMRKRGASLLEISKKCSISKSTASLWLRDIKLDLKAREILAKKGGNSWQKALAVKSKLRQGKLSKIDKDAKVYLNGPNAFKNDSLLLCSLLYWCEGVKAGGVVNFVNSDPSMVSFFLKLLRHSFVLDETKFRVCLHLHPYHNELTQEKFWSNIINIPISQFNKSFVKKNGGKNIRKDYPGCVSIRYHDCMVFYKLLSVFKQIK